MNNMLYDSYKASGTTEKEFQEVMENLMACTESVSVNPAETFLLSFHDKKDEPIKGTKDIKRTYRFYKLDRDSISSMEKHNCGLSEIPFSTIIHNGKPNSTAKFFEDITNGSGLMMAYWDDKHTLWYCGVSEYGIFALCSKADMTGPRVYKRSLFRDIYIADGLLPDFYYGEGEETLKRNRKIIEDGLKVIVRRDRTKGPKENKASLGLIVGVFTQTYASAGADVVLPLYEALSLNPAYGKSEMVSWSVTQGKIEVQMEFPEKAEEYQEKYHLPKKYIPGIRIISSDSGLASLTVQGTYRLENTNCTAIVNEFTKPHRNSVDVKATLKEINCTVCRPLHLFAKKLGGYYKMQVCEGSPASEKEKEENRIAVRDVMETGLRNIVVSNAIGEKRKKKISSMLCEQINEEQAYTMGDVAEHLFHLEEYILKIDKVKELNSPTKDRVWKDIGNIAKLA